MNINKKVKEILSLKALKVQAGDMVVLKINEKYVNTLTGTEIALMSKRLKSEFPDNQTAIIAGNTELIIQILPNELNRSDNDTDNTGK